ncbi:MAG: hypothetical protein IPO78_15510 [Saprospiraceae bacterium]|nr:hypothetical protein [Saprospiraceae bacterium]MBK9222323.1 hypothetical protein [Saprospiraceae bacterium]MBK9723002.1 hypothetical protein [Saprospiraceae bacterium]
MKNSNKVLIAILFVAILLLTCKTESKKPASQMTQISQDTINTSPNQKRILSAVEKAAIPMDIPRDTARELIKEWVKVIDSIQSHNDMGMTNIERSVLVSKADLVTFMNTIPADGYLRIYFGYYNKNNPLIAKYLVDYGKFATYNNRFSVILSAADSDLNYLDRPLKNLGGLCPPEICGTEIPE